MEHFDDNQPYAFSVHLPRPLTLNGHWTISLLETCLPSGKKKNTEVFIYTNLCEDTIVGNKEVPLLRRVYLDGSPNKIFTLPYEVPIRLGQVHDVQIYIKDATGQKASFLQGEVSVTLQLKYKGSQ
jgi:hypothetical protein